MPEIRDILDGINLMSPPLIALRNVTYGYHCDRPVLRGASLEIGTGDRIALTGCNGAGKTTLLHVMVGLLLPHEGYVETGGVPCRRESDFVPVRRWTGLVFQNPDDQLFCPTVLDDVAFGPLNLGQAPEQARRSSLEALDRLGMADYAHRMTHHLSVGEKKMIALATVLSMAPRVLLLDEPTAGLDEAARERVVKVLNELDASLLVASQDRAFLGRVSRSHLTLGDGRIHAGERLIADQGANRKL